MTLSKTQQDAVYDAVRASLPSAWPDDSIRWVRQDHPRTGDRWCSLMELPTLTKTSIPEQVNVAQLQEIRIDFPADAATTITIDPQADAATPTTSTEGPSGSATLLRDAHFANLDGASTFWTATKLDVVGLDPAIVIQATELGRGIWLKTTLTAPLTQTLLRDYQLVAVRDLEEVTVSIQVFSRLDDDNPDPDLGAAHVLGEMKLRLFAPTVITILRAANCPPARRTDVIDLSDLVGGSQWETRAQLSVILSRMGLILDQPGTVESVQGTGTIQPGDLSVPFSASSED